MCMCVYVCVCVYTCIYVRMYVYMYACVCVLFYSEVDFCFFLFSIGQIGVLRL